jgi:glyoxylase-like metal-dependent hydrolase (beta-lactamase superfamily II)
LDWDRDSKHLDASPDYCWYSWPQQRESITRLLQYSFNWVLPGHGQRIHLPALAMRKHLQDMVRRMDRVQR